MISRQNFDDVRDLSAGLHARMRLLEWALSMLVQASHTIAHDYRIACECDLIGDGACCECRFYDAMRDGEALLDAKELPADPLKTGEDLVKALREIRARYDAMKGIGT